MRAGPDQSGSVRRFASDASDFVQQRVLFQHHGHKQEFFSLNEQRLQHQEASAAAAHKPEKAKVSSSSGRPEGGRGFAKRFTPTVVNIGEDGFVTTAQPSSVPPTPSHPRTAGVDQALRTSFELAGLFLAVACFFRIFLSG